MLLTIPMSLFRNISSMRTGCFLASLLLICILISTMTINDSEIKFENNPKTTFDSFSIALFLFSCQNNVPEIFQVTLLILSIDDFSKEVKGNSKKTMLKSLSISTFFCIILSILFGIFYNNTKYFDELTDKKSLGNMTLVK